MSLICVIWHSHKSIPAGKFVRTINASGDGFHLIAHSWLRWLLIVYAAPTLGRTLLFFQVMNHLAFKLGWEVPFSK